MRARYPDAVLVDSGAWGSYADSGFWVTVRAAPSDDSTPVLDWCGAEGWARGDCLAKRLTRAGPPEGNTDLRD